MVKQNKLTFENLDVFKVEGQYPQKSLTLYEQYLTNFLFGDNSKNTENF